MNAPKEIGVMGGAFDPIHNLHLTVAMLAYRQFDLEKVIFVPSGSPPHKAGKILEGEIRLKMVEAAVACNPAFEASASEVQRKGTSWSIDTLHELSEQFGEGFRLNFIIGEDVLRSFRTYERTGEFLSLCRILICPRRNRSIEALRKRVALDLPGADFGLIESPPFILSSTLVREWVKRGYSIRYLVPGAVSAIIESESLYL